MKVCPKCGKENNEAGNVTGVCIHCFYIEGGNNEKQN